MTVLYDAGMLIAAAANQRQVWADHKARLQAGIEPLTTAPVVAQVSRSPRQVQLRRFLRGCRIVAFEPEHAHRVGELIAAAGGSDVMDAHLALVAADARATIRTGDLDDLEVLARYTEHAVAVRGVS